MKYTIIYIFNTGKHNKTNRIEIDAESLDEVIYKFKEAINEPFSDVHLAIFDKDGENVYEGELYFPHILTKEEQEIVAWQESLPKRIDKVKSILENLGIKLKVTCCYYDEEPTITFEYEEEKILNDDECSIDMYTDK